MDRTRPLHFVVLAAMLFQGNAFIVRPTEQVKNIRIARGNQQSGLFQSAISVEDETAPCDADKYYEKSSDPSRLIKRGGDIAKAPLNGLAKFYNWYNNCLIQKPILTKGVTAAFVNLFGDFLAQFIEASVAGTAFVPNFVRLQGFFLCGLIYVGPYVHTWYEQLWKIGSWMEKKYDSPKQVQTFVQLLVDQTVGVAIFFSTYFYAFELIDALVSHRCKYLMGRKTRLIQQIC